MGVRTGGIAPTEFPRPLGIDSANWFNQGNYRGRIREIIPGTSLIADMKLEDVVSRVLDSGYFLKDMCVVNLADGDSKKNEPSEAIFLFHPEKGDGLIVKHYGSMISPVTYRFYDESNFIFIQ